MNGFSDVDPIVQEMIERSTRESCAFGSTRLFAGPNFAADLLTVETIQPGRIVKMADGLLTVAVGSALLTASEQNLPANTIEVYVCIRAEDVILLKGGDAPTSARNRLPAVIQSLVREGPLMHPGRVAR